MSKTPRTDAVDMLLKSTRCLALELHELIHESHSKHVMAVITELTQAQERIKEYEKEIKERIGSFEMAKSYWIEQNVETQKEIKRLREALEFYADENNHFVIVDVPGGVTMSFTGGSHIDIDKGQRAKQALEKPHHVCGLMGFRRGRNSENDRCIACEQENKS